jgi:hypothetical protein
MATSLFIMRNHRSLEDVERGGLAALLVAFACAASACTPSVAVRIQHPAMSGALDGQPLASTDWWTENQYGFERGVLQSEVVLVRFDAQAVCVAAKLRAAEDSSRVDLRSTIREMLADPDGSLTPPYVRTIEPRAFQAMGVRYEQQDSGSTTTTCVAPITDDAGNEVGCSQYQTDPVYETVALDQAYTVYEGGGIACYANTGAVNPATEEIRVWIRGTNYIWELEGANELGQWRTDPSGQPMMVVAAGFEQLRTPSWQQLFATAPVEADSLEARLARAKVQLDPSFDPTPSFGLVNVL